MAKKRVTYHVADYSGKQSILNLLVRILHVGRVPLPKTMVNAHKFLSLVVLSLLMGGSSYLSGLVPISIPLSPARVRAISVFGMGILMGTSLVIIIPEGIETLYDSREMMSQSRLSTRDDDDDDDDSDDDDDDKDDDDESDKDKGKDNKDKNKDNKDKDKHKHKNKDKNKDKNKEVSLPDNESQSKTVGVMLLFGFLMMYLLDNFQLIMKTLPEQLKNFRPLPADEESSSTFSVSTTVPPAPYANEKLNLFHKLFVHNPSLYFKILCNSPTTVGLVVHSLTDGIALTSSVLSTDSTLEFMVFIAIIIHKIPASFGLTAVLLRPQTLSTKEIKVLLAWFAASAPAGAFITFIVIKLIGSSDQDSSLAAATNAWYTGALLLFSGGTFLYVGVHAMLDMIHSDDEQDSTEDQVDHQKEMSPLEFGLSILGMMVPLCVSFVKDI